MDYRYWDSATFLGWLSVEPDKVPSCKPVLQAAEAGTVTLITSALTIVEVIRLKGHERIPAHQTRKIDAFFKNSWIIVREVDRFIAEDARELVWDKNAKPIDAVHLATALRQDVQIDQFDTFDEGLIKHSGSFSDPPLTIGRPSLPPKLPFEIDHDDEDSNS